MQEPRLLPAGTRAAASALPDLTAPPDLRGLLVGERPNGTRTRTEGAAMITGEAISSSQAVSHTTGAIRTDGHWCCYGGINALSPSVPRQWRPTFAMRGTPFGGEAPPPSQFDFPTGSRLRVDAIAPRGRLPGSDPGFARQELLDRYGIRTDYPHWEADTPGTVFQSLPESQKSKLLQHNAQEMLWW